jgi:hypothetical protein
MKNSTGDAFQASKITRGPDTLNAAIVQVLALPIALFRPHLVWLTTMLSMSSISTLTRQAPKAATFHNERKATVTLHGRHRPDITAMTRLPVHLIFNPAALKACCRPAVPCFKVLLASPDSSTTNVAAFLVDSDHCNLLAGRRQPGGVCGARPGPSDQLWPPRPGSCTDAGPLGGRQEWRCRCLLRRYSGDPTCLWAGPGAADIQGPVANQ